MKALKEIKTVEEARKIRPDDLLGEELSKEDLINLLKIFQAFWEYPSEPDPNIPHAKLRDGRHSNGFINIATLLVESIWCEIFGDQMSDMLSLACRLYQDFSSRIDWVISAAYSGIDFGHEIARQFGVRHAFTEKDNNGDPTIWKRHTIQKGEVVLVVNELMTNGSGSTWHIKKAIMEQNPVQPVIFAPIAGVLVNRSWEDETLADGTPVVSFARFKMQTFDPGPETCPYCAAGSQALKPKVGNNWQKYFS